MGKDKTHKKVDKEEKSEPVGVVKEKKADAVVAEKP